jgi:hypothetical protein
MHFRRAHRHRYMYRTQLIIVRCGGIVGSGGRRHAPVGFLKFSCQYTINENGPDVSPDVDACAVREGIVTAHRCHPDRAEVNDDELT